MLSFNYRLLGDKTKLISFKNEPLSTADFERIVRLIEARDPNGFALLHDAFSEGMRYLAGRYSPEHADDCVHDTMLIVVRQIEAGQLAEPAALPGYINTVLKRTAWKKNLRSRQSNRETAVFELAAKTRPDHRLDPHKELIEQEKVEVMQRGLSALRPIEREVLVRFYLQSETKEEICRAMGITETTFRLLKSRSKAKLQQVVASVVEYVPLHPVSAMAAVA